MYGNLLGCRGGSFGCLLRKRVFSTSFVRANPEYRIYGETCLLSFKALVPTFKGVGQSNKLVVNKPGRMLLEFVPRLSGNNYGFSYSDRQAIALSPEELGLVLSQIPKNLSVRIFRDGSSRSYNSGGYSSGGQGTFDKILTISPSSTGSGSVSFGLTPIDEHGRSIEDNQHGIPPPMEVEVQAGEYEIVKSICNSSLTSLNGFDALLKCEMDYALQQARDDESPNMQPFDNRPIMK